MPASESNESLTPQEKTLKWAKELIEYYDSRAQRYGTQLFWLKVLGATSTVCVTVLSGIQHISNCEPWIITVVAGFATLFTSLLAATKSHEYYLIAAVSKGKVNGELHLYEGCGGPYGALPDDEARAKLLAERIYNIYAEGRQDLQRANQPEREGP